MILLCVCACVCAFRTDRPFSKIKKLTFVVHRRSTHDVLGQPRGHLNPKYLLEVPQEGWDGEVPVVLPHAFLSRLLRHGAVHALDHGARVPDGRVLKDVHVFGCRLIATEYRPQQLIRERVRAFEQQWFH